MVNSWSAVVRSPRKTVNFSSQLINAPYAPVLATACLQVQSGNGSFEIIRVLCDTGAQVNLLSELAFRKLRLKREPDHTNVMGVNDTPIKTRGKVEIQIWHRNHRRLLAKSDFVIIENFDLRHPRHSFAHVPFGKVPKCDFADPLYNISGPVDGIIGVGILAPQMGCNLRRNSVGLLAQATSFGWIIFGGNDEPRVDALATISLVTANDIYNQVKKLWELDDIDEPRALSVEDQACEALYQSTIVKREGRYSVTPLLKPKVELGESRAMARRRLYCLENRLNKSPGLRESYVQFMDEYESLGHMRPAEPLDPTVLHYYIPHHAVSIDRKFRVVFDASAKTSNGRSLNEVQYVGPRLQKDLMDIVMNFRTGQFAITADICKMFRQIEMQPAYWDLQRILWRRSAKEPIRDYWLTVVTYGMTSSPYNAVKTLQQCAIDHSTQSPVATRTVMNDFYMDDLLTSVESNAEAVKVKAELIALLVKGGFELAKWRSNCESIMSGQLDPKIVSEQDSTSVLGIAWNYVKDEFQFKVQIRVQPEVLTKRIVTSEAARIYDPQGYVTPVTIRAKLFIQELWRTGSGWDDPLPPDLQTEWRSFYEELKAINRVKVPRWLSTTSTAKIQIHVYCDASSKAYGAAAYVRVFDNNRWSAKLLCSRSRVAPLKLVTIPRLELCAIELGCKLLPKIKGISMLSNAPASLWTDSEIALFWIRKPVNELKTFVANRVNRILQSVPVEQTRHVKSEDNPADLLSRGSKPEALIDNTLWWHGPSALSKDAEEWAEWNISSTGEETSDQINTEVKKASQSSAGSAQLLLTVAMSGENETQLIDQKSSRPQLCRVTAYVLRFCHGAFKRIYDKGKRTVPLLAIYASQSWQSDAFDVIKCERQSHKVPCPTIRECENAMNYWAKAAQERYFPSEYEAVRREKELSRKSPLWTLTPQLDPLGVLRIYGRLNNTDLSDELKHPIILHRNCTLARLLAEESHRVLCHGGVQMCTQYLRHKYWIIGVRILLRKVVYHCATCARYRQNAGKQFMADLPAIRLQPRPAFEHTGVDYAGPIVLKQSRNVTTKGYIAVFVCMVYKAIHLELVSSLNAESFIAALTRFVNLRAGSVQHMYSDNGTNFVRANRELQEAYEIWHDHDVMRHLEGNSIQWHFNTPAAPHHGGLWEAAVKSTKTHLRKMGGAHLFTYEELATLLAKIGACLNSRPLTPISSDPSDMTTLTPGHFLTGRAILTPYEGYLAKIPMNRLSAWQKMQKLQQDFWTRWSQECITEQQRRNKWANSYDSLKIGDLVFIRNETTPPSQWLMGRIIEVFPGRDGRVRSCNVRTEKSTFVRPVTQLCLLPIEVEDDTSETGFP